jgi:hypothetical protein
MNGNHAQEAQGAANETAQSGKPDQRQSWPATIREKHERADAALARQAQERGWTPAALARMRDALTREHAALARAAQERNRREAQARRLAQADAGAKRRRETQEKIILGALAQRAGVACVRDNGSIDRAVFLGALLDLRAQFEAVSSEDRLATIERWRALGRESLGLNRSAA